LKTLPQSITDTLLQSDVQICQSVAAALEDSASRAHLAKMCVGLPAPTIVTGETDLQYVQNDTDLVAHCGRVEIAWHGTIRALA
jgi:hypothetical protein